LHAFQNVIKILKICCFLCTVVTNNWIRSE